MVAQGSAEYRVMLWLAAFLSVAVAGETPVAGPDPGVRWFGIALGTAAVRYREQLGDPLRVTALSGPPERKARYLLARAPLVFLILTERNGAVTAIESFSAAQPSGPVTSVDADPAGIRLGTLLADVLAARPAASRWTDADGDVHLQEDVDAARGVVADFRFSHDLLVADTWLLKQSGDVPQLPGALPLSEAAGEGESSAILDVQRKERDGVDWEYLYLRMHPCDRDQLWRRGAQSVRTAHGRAYDVLDVTCPSTGAQRAFYFDVTAFFGKL